MERKEQINILEYWRAFESFVMPNIECAKKTEFLERAPLILTVDTPLPWPFSYPAVKTQKASPDVIFCVYVGIIRHQTINKKIQEILASQKEDYDLAQSRNYACLAGFIVNNQGYINQESYITPDFLKSLYSLERFNSQEDWLKNYELAKREFKKISEIFLSKNSYSPITFDEIHSHLRRLLECFKCITDEHIEFSAVVHVKKLREFDQFENNYMNESESNFETMKLKSAYLDILPSFYLQDLNSVINDIGSKSCSRALEEYLSGGPKNSKKDLYRDRIFLRKLMNPKNLPPAKWPDAKDQFLSLAQQAAINIAVSESKGLFSVNGPPGTGKTTLLRDIVSDVLIKRANVLAEFEDPSLAFKNPVTTQERLQFKSYALDARLLGYEVLVAASNNNAAENISRELPTLRSINSKYLEENKENEYFSEVATHYFGDEEPCWGMIAAVLGNQENNTDFFNHFWGKDDPKSMRNVLNLGSEGEHFLKMEWKKERKKFRRLKKLFEKNQSQYVEIEQCLEAREGILNSLRQANESFEAFLDEEEANKNLLECLTCQYEEAQENILNDKESLKIINHSKSIFENYQNSKEELALQVRQIKNRSEHICNLEQEFAKLPSEISNLEDYHSDLDQRKQDHLHLKPRWFLWWRRKDPCVLEWRKNFSSLSRENATGRKLLREKKARFSQLQIDLIQEKALYHEQEKSLVLKRKEYIQNKRVFLNLDTELNYENILHEFNLISQKIAKNNLFLEDVALKISESTQAVENTNRKKLKLTDEIRELGDKIKSLDNKIASVKNEFLNSQENFPEVGYWDRPSDKLQITAPWMNKKIQNIRIQLFWSAIRLHRYFILLSRKPIRSNITALNWLLRDKLPEEHHKNIRSIWASLFLIVPVVSSTFASIQRLFRHLKQEEIGWLFIDEAGQTPPHHAVGALWRSKRAIIVGDPLQIEPVITLPKILSKKLYNYHNVSSLFDITIQSVQTISDISNPFGTFIGNEEEGIWVGAPLIVHRRCCDPMFSIANEIAYDNLMIQATLPEFSILDPYLNQSLWINPKHSLARDEELHWIEKEGEIACYIIDRLIHQLGVLPPFFVITPFVSVKQGMIKYINEKYLIRWSLHLQMDKNKLKFALYELIGTIHTFQGKQADMVILLLGGNEQKLGAISWASERPNILNVAITRAKKLLYVIGSIKLWGNQPHFSKLAASLPIVNDGESFKKACFSGLQDESLTREIESQ